MKLRKECAVKESTNLVQVSSESGQSSGGSKSRLVIGNVKLAVEISREIHCSAYQTAFVGPLKALQSTE
ncbi:CLUMA_CG019899, isoform A [Clunio marinus]|uniref:CLUMA_CG019899, isoform A n=1 Tax=Clunio marinus TaxID=568069 RepID=A0A1J1J2E5_9DIPT|nr:CLUMA_CG019899, isoform A [Clunio marinus]